jgi:hypothetical protein
MTPDDIERIAREAGDDWDSTLGSDREFLARFARLISAECATVCDDSAARLEAVKRMTQVDAHMAGILRDKAKAIREKFGA